MNELTSLRVFSKTQFDFLGQCQGLLLIGADEQTAEVFYCTRWASEDEAQRSLNARYAALKAGSPHHDSSRAEGLMVFDELRSLCADRSALLDELAENEAYPDLVGDEEVWLGEVLGETEISLLTTLIEQAKNRLFTIAGGNDL